MLFRSICSTSSSVICSTLMYMIPLGHSSFGGCPAIISSVRSFKETKRRIEKDAEKKLREASVEQAGDEVEQQKREDLKERTDEIIAGHPPNEEWPSGIMYIKVEQITELEVEHIKESGLRVL